MELLQHVMEFQWVLMGEMGPPWKSLECWCPIQRVNDGKITATVHVEKILNLRDDSDAF